MRAGRRIAVLGGAGGIGRALVARLIAERARVTVLDLPLSLERHPPPSEVHVLALDVTDPRGIAAAAQALETAGSALDGCVNLVGFGHPIGPLTGLDDAQLTELWDGNLLGAIRWARAVEPLLRKGEAPSLVQVSSGLGQYIRPGYGGYAAAKAGLIAVTKTLALEWAPAIRVNAVGPGAVDTAFLRGGTGRSDENSELRLDMSRYIDAIPMKRLAAPADVVGPIMFLLGDDSAYMTGQVLWINGGAYMP